MNKLGIVILAAGAASRFGSCKQLAKINGKPMLQHAVDKALALTPEHTYVVSGNYRAEIETTITGTKFLYNPSWQEGIGSSITCATTALKPSYQQLLFMLGDQIALTTSDLKKLISNETDTSICCAFYKGKRGVPALFQAGIFEELESLSGDTGAKELLHRHHNVIEINMPNAAIDIDSTNDLERLSLES